MTIEKYIKNNPNIQFTFEYIPESVGNSTDKRYWRCKFSKSIKDTHTIGYATKTYKELINAIVNESD